jgi:hypothetical protein
MKTLSRFPRLQINDDLTGAVLSLAVFISGALTGLATYGLSAVYFGDANSVAYKWTLLGFAVREKQHRRRAVWIVHVLHSVLQLGGSGESPCFYIGFLCPMYSNIAVDFDDCNSLCRHAFYGANSLEIPHIFCIFFHIFLS